MALPKQAQPKLRIPLPVDKSFGLGDVFKSATTKMGFIPLGGCQQRVFALIGWLFSTQYREVK
jgi:hypothetical protein